ncbi:hypothetical protein BH09ACT12_BH09ACT12_29100 [soil metagenome]
MQIDLLTPDDRERVLAHVELTNAARRHDTPWVHLTTPHRDEMGLRHGWDGEPGVSFLGTEDGVTVAAGAYDTSVHDNQHIAWFDVEVHPDHRGRGLGDAMLAHLMARATDEGKTSVGISCWDTPAGFAGFGQRYGFERKAVGVNRRQHLSEVDPTVVRRLHDEARAAAGDYDLVRTLGSSDDAELEALAVLTAAINDAPKEGLEVEDQVFSAERIRT